MNVCTPPFEVFTCFREMGHYRFTLSQLFLGAVLEVLKSFKQVFFKKKSKAFHWLCQGRVGFSLNRSPEKIFS